MPHPIHLKNVEAVPAAVVLGLRTEVFHLLDESTN
jgi:hypothetical protein